MAIRLRTVMWSLLALAVVLLIGMITAVGWQVVLGPKMRPVTARRFDATPARLARGQYLVEGVAGCFHCHSDHDLTNPEYPVIPSLKGAGWVMPIPELGRLVAPNITPDRETGLGTWTDDEIARAIQEGVDKNGRALFPLMPWPNYRHLTDEDLASTVVYLRSIPAVRHAVPATKLIVPLNVLVKTMPQPLTRPEPLPQASVVEQGAYLVTVASCRDCHSTADDRGMRLAGMDLAGGNPFHLPEDLSKQIVSANITPDASGIAHYDDDLFIETLRTGRLPGRSLSFIMPFENFRNLTDDDLKAMFAYLRTVAAVKHNVTNNDPPTACPIDGRMHGLGAMNVSGAKK
jgi:mono/diheme cytochrome c family protein